MQLHILCVGQIASFSSGGVCVMAGANKQQTTSFCGAFPHGRWGDFHVRDLTGQFKNRHTFVPSIYYMSLHFSLLSSTRQPSVEKSNDLSLPHGICVTTVHNSSLFGGHTSSRVPHCVYVSSALGPTLTGDLKGQSTRSCITSIEPHTEPLTSIRHRQTEKS